MIDREALYSAFFAAVQTVPGVVTFSRRLKHWSDVPPNEQPAIFQCQVDEAPQEIRGLPTRWYCNVKLWVYVNTGDDQAGVPTTLLNPILNGIEAAFPKQPASGFQGLNQLVWEQGGIAYNICFEGVETFEGTLGAQEVAVVRVRITAV